MGQEDLLDYGYDPVWDDEDAVLIMKKADEPKVINHPIDTSNDPLPIAKSTEPPSFWARITIFWIKTTGCDEVDVALEVGAVLQARRLGMLALRTVSADLILMPVYRGTG